jgi:hypothetical protein
MMTKVFEQQGLLLECDFQDHDQETWWLSLTDESGNVTKRQITLHLTKIILSGVYSYRPMCHGCFKPYRFEGSPEGVEYCQNEIEEFGIEASIGDSRSDTGWAGTSVLPPPHQRRRSTQMTCSMTQGYN